MNPLKVVKNTDDILKLRIELINPYILLSVNQSLKPGKNRYTGKMFLYSSPEMTAYKKYVNSILALKPVKVCEGLLDCEVITDYQFYLSSRYTSRDVSNIFKNMEDLIHKKIGINDNKVKRIIGEKNLCEGNEYVEFTMTKWIEEKKLSNGTKQV